MYKTKFFAARIVLATYYQTAVFTAREDGIT